MMDKDGSGSIDKEEWGGTLRELGLLGAQASSFNYAEADALFAILDKEYPP